MTATDSTEPTEPTEPIDWNRFWCEADDGDRTSATPSTHHVRELLDAFVAEHGVPDTFADVGCGPGVVSFHVARQYSETSVVGYDLAPSILTENRQRARETAVDNVRFERAVLPAFAPDRQFDLVLCYGTLAYVTASADALEHLYDAVAPGGHLVLGYCNRNVRAHHQRMLASPENHPDPDFDPERFAERFRFVLEGKSTLSYRQIHGVLGTWPRSFWEFTEKPDDPWAWDHVPLVWLPQ